MVRQGLAGLEGKIATSGDGEGRASGVASALRRLRLAILSGLALCLAAAPPALVAWDLWFGRSSIRGELRPAWCAIEFLCQTDFPPYFLLIFPLTVILVVVVLRASRPGWRIAPESGLISFGLSSTVFPEVVSTSALPKLLKTMAAIGYLLIGAAAFTLGRFSPWAYLPVVIAYFAGVILEGTRLDRLIEALRGSSRKILVIGISHLALILFLRSHQAGDLVQWAFALLFVLSLVGMLRMRREIGPIAWIVLAAIVIFSSRIASWQLAVVGDEYAFFRDAKDIITPLRPAEVISHLFDGTWTYASHPYVSSLIQAISMFFLGRDNFGWRFSNIYLSAVSIGFFYLFFKGFFSRRVAMLAALLLASSHFLMNFSKIGYNNLQALFVMSLVLWLTEIAVRSGRPIAYSALGIGMAGCFYVFPGALYVLPLPLVLIAMHSPGRGRNGLGMIALALASLLLLTLPLVLQAEFWESKLAGVFVHDRELASNTAYLGFHFASNMLYSLFSYLFIPNESHFVVSSYLDPLSAVFVPIGLALCLQEARRSKSAAFLIVAFLIEAVLIGTTHDRPFPTATRMFLMLPWFFLLAAVGMDWGLDLFGRKLAGGSMVPAVAGYLIVAILGLNFYQSTRIFRLRTTGAASLEALFLRMLQHDAQEDPNTLKDYLFITAPDWGIDGFLTLQDVYKVPPSPTQLHWLVAESSELPEEEMELISQPNTVVIIQPWMDETVRLGLEDRLVETGKERCQVSDTPLTDPQFSIWYSPGLQDLCVRANADW